MELQDLSQDATSSPGLLATGEIVSSPCLRPLPNLAVRAWRIWVFISHMESR